jgi:hypothetical protein
MSLQSGNSGIKGMLRISSAPVRTDTPKVARRLMSERRQTLALATICITGLFCLCAYIALGTIPNGNKEVIQGLKEILSATLGALSMYVRVRALPDTKEPEQ